MCQFYISQASNVYLLFMSMKM